MELKEVISKLEKFDRKYKREQVTYAIEHREEITPYLLNILKNVLEEPFKYAQDENYFGHIYTLMLLGYFQETKAHDLLIELFSLQDELIEDLFGDIALEEFQGALYQTCGRSVEKIKKLALNQQASDSTRNSAISALLYTVVDGVITREETLQFLSTLFTGDETVQPSDFWSFVACDICDLCPDATTYEVIKRAYRDHLIDDDIVGFEEFQEAIDQGVEASLNDIRNLKNRRFLNDFHARMSKWACFEKKDQVDPHLFLQPEQRKPKKANTKPLHPKKKKKK
jgi:hypothetical protein